MLLSYSKANENDAMDDSKDEVIAPTKANKKSAKKRKSIENEESTEINDDVMEDEAATKETAKEEDNVKKAPAKKGRKKAKNAA